MQATTETALCTIQELCKFLEPTADAALALAQNIRIITP